MVAPGNGGAAPPVSPARLPLGRSWRWPWWRSFCEAHRWAGGPPSASLPSLARWQGIAEEIDARVDQVPYRNGPDWPLQLPAPGQAIDCMESALIKMRAMIEAGFPAGDARVLILRSPAVNWPDHAALVLRLAEGDYVLDNRNPQAVAGLHHWSLLRRRPVLVTEGKGEGRTVRLPAGWRAG